MSEIKEAVIISAVRTPVGKLLGSLKGFTATELGAIVVRESVRRAGVAPEDVDEVIKTPRVRLPCVADCCPRFQR